MGISPSAWANFPANVVFPEPPHPSTAMTVVSPMAGLNLRIDLERSSKVVIEFFIVRE
jgi:hypothetical protein